MVYLMNINTILISSVDFHPNTLTSVVVICASLKQKV